MSATSRSGQLQAAGSAASRPPSFSAFPAGLNLVQSDAMGQAITIRSRDGTEVLSLTNVRLDGHPFILLAEVHLRTYNCSWDEQTLVFDRDHADELEPLLEKLRRSEACEAMLQLRHDMDNLAFHLDAAGRATVTGELTFAHGWEGFGFDVDPEALANFVGSLARAVASAE